jgi:hypothetical protein
MRILCVDGFYNFFVSVSSKDILMIACCSNYLAGGELKEQKRKKEDKNVVDSFSRIMRDDEQENGRAFL